MAQPNDIRRARQALARADRVLGFIARRYADVVDDSGYEPWVDERYIHWPGAWLRQASQDEIFAWVAHYGLAWALGHEWRIFSRPDREDFSPSRYQFTPERTASLIETSCMLYFSRRRPRDWRPLIELEKLERWRGIPAEEILLDLEYDQENLRWWGPYEGDPKDCDNSDGDADGDW